MSKQLSINPAELKFDHFVIAKNQNQNTIFASARIKGKIENFLIDLNGEWVKQQVNHHFKKLPYELGRIIAKKAEAFYGKIRVYRIPSFDFLS